MNIPPRKQPLEPVTDRASAIRALSRVRPDSLPLALTEILAIASHALAARRASFWRLSGDRRSLRLLARHEAAAAVVSCRTLLPGTRVSASALPARLLEDTTQHWMRRHHADFAALAAGLEFSPRTHAVLTQPVAQFGDALGVVCVELAQPGECVDAETALFLQLVAARIEAVYLAEPPASHPRRRDDRAAGVQLAPSDATLRDLFEFAPTALILTDATSARPLAANRHALSMFCVGSLQADALHAGDFWDDAADRDRFVTDVLARGFVHGHRARLRRADGRTFWARLSATAIDHDGRAALISSITDVSELVAAEEILHRTQKTMSTLLEASPFPLIVTRLDNGVIRYCNQKAADMFETPLSGLLGHTAPEFYVEPGDRAHFVEKLREAGKVDGFIAQLKTASGQPFWAMLSAKTLELNDEPVFMVAFADVTKQKNKEEELQTLAFKDGLTGAYNRRYFTEAAQRELARAARHGRAPVIALLDIDHFKHLNDTHGHEAGDVVLRQFVELVNSLLRKTDLLARYGGEEFAVLLPETDIADARAILERIRETIAAHRFTMPQGTTSVTFSAGLAAADGAVAYQPELARADAALYAAKRNGRNRIEQG